jgi:hypothetical protein
MQIYSKMIKHGQSLHSLSLVDSTFAKPIDIHDC